jgi:hypothetical protein
VATAANGNFKVARSRQPDRVYDIGSTEAARDQRRPPVDEPVVDASDIVVSSVGRLKQLSGECWREFGDRSCRGHEAPPSLKGKPS